ncbi:hypothetical protein V3528_10150 [Acinetobacter johnsonii]|uniref:hypothetical protein n=1 Tax=Acinetobacter johnsonii TaxID=40214 RepID=UPI0030FBC50F
MENTKLKYFINLTFLNDAKFDALPKEGSAIDRQLNNYRNSKNDELIELLFQLEPKQANSSFSIKLIFDKIKQEFLRNLTPKECILLVAYLAYPIGVEDKLEQILKKVPSLYLVLSDNKTSLEIREIIENIEYISSILRKSLSICVKDGWFIVDCVFYKVLEMEFASIIKQVTTFLEINSINRITMTDGTKLLIDATKSSQASKGGQTKAENYRAKMNPIFDELFDLFQNPHPVTARKWKSKSECAKYFIKEFYLKNPDTEIDLDPKKLVAEITNRINDRSTSK